MEIISQGVGTIEAILERDGVYPSVTRGVSMRPLLKTHRDMVILSKCGGELKKYDVALYKCGEKYILHRVIAIDRERAVYVIRGDNTFKKEYIPFDKILARLTVFKRRGKHHTVEEKGYKIYCRLWNFIYPIRFVIHYAVAVPRKIARLVFKSNNTHK